MQDTAQLIAVILLAAFALERIDAAAKFLLDPAPAADDARSQKRRKILLFSLAGAVALAFVDFGNIRIVEQLQPQNAPKLLDYWLTWLVVVAGADRVKDFLQGAKVKEAKAPPTPTITIVPDAGLSAHRVA